MPIQIYRYFFSPKTENFQIKNSDIFHISAQNIDYEYSLELPRWGGSNEYPQSMFWAEIRKNNVKVGLKGVKMIQVCFRDANKMTDLSLRWARIFVCSFPDFAAEMNIIFCHRDGFKFTFSPNTVLTLNRRTDRPKQTVRI